MFAGLRLNSYKVGEFSAIKITKEKEVLLYMRVMQSCTSVGLRHFNFSVTATDISTKAVIGIFSDDFEVKVDFLLVQADVW